VREEPPVVADAEGNRGGRFIVSKFLALDNISEADRGEKYACFAEGFWRTVTACANVNTNLTIRRHL
jgi:hypothetical protein